MGCVPPPQLLCIPAVSCLLTHRMRPRGSPAEAGGRDSAALVSLLSKGGQAWPGRLLAPEQGGRVPGADPQPVDALPPLPSSQAGAHPDLVQVGASFSQLLTGPGPPFLGSSLQWGATSLVPMEEASSPLGSLIQAPGSCAVALRQLFLA